MPRAAAADKRSTATGYITTSGNNFDKKYQQQKTTKYTQKNGVHKSKNLPNLKKGLPKVFQKIIFLRK